MSVIPKLRRRPLIVGERINAHGSRTARRLLLAGDLDGIVELGRHQLAAGAHVLDVCVAMEEQPGESALMAAVVGRLSTSLAVPIMIDTTDPAVIVRALEQTPDSVIVNSINVQQGRARADVVVPAVKRWGAALVALTIDEAGTAKTAARKLEIAQRIYGIVVGDHGMPAGGLFLDPLTFSLGTGRAEWIDSAKETIDGIRAIKSHLPGVSTILGISDVSFTLAPPARVILNSVFLHHCVGAGLDAAIVDPAHIHPIAAIAEEDRQLAEDLLFNRAGDALPRFVARFQQ